MPFSPWDFLTCCSVIWKYVILISCNIEGQVLLDGHDTRCLELKWLRSRIGLVNQEPALFATTIKDNILFGMENSSFDDVVKAARISGAHDFINQLPAKYDTQVRLNVDYIA